MIVAGRNSPSERAFEGFPRWLMVAYVTLVIIALVATELVFRHLSGKTQQSAESLVWVATFLVLGGLGFGLILLRQIAHARRSQHALNQTRAALRAMNEALVVPLGPFNLNRLLNETLGRVARTLESDGGSVYILSEDRRLDRSVTFGDKGMDPGSGVLQGVVRSRATAMGVSEGGEDDPNRRSWNYLAAPLLSDEQAVGVIVIGSVRRHPYTELDAGVLELVAERLATAVERDRLVDRERRSRLAAERARGLLAVLNEAADALAPAVESYDAALGQLVEHVVPAFADWFEVDLADEPDGSLRTAASGGGDDLLHLRKESPATSEQWREFLGRVMADGSPHLAYSRRTGSAVSDREHPGLMARLGAASYLVVPIRVRGLSFGTLSFVTRTHRRGFRPSDMPPAEALAERVAVTIERVMTYAEVREAEQTARRQATHLRRVSQATMAVSAAPLSEEGTLAVVAEQARLVTGASQAVVTVVDGTSAERCIASPPLGGEEQPQVSLDKLVRSTNRPVRWTPDTPDADDGRQKAWMAAPLTTATGENRGSVVVFRSGSSFTADEESVLLSLAQLASVAFEKLRLYREVQEGQARLEVLIDSSPVAIVELTTSGEPTRWNRTAEVLLGWPDRPPVAGFAGGTADDPGGGFDEIWERTARGETVAATDGVVRRSDGTNVEISVTTAPLRGPDGRVASLLAVMEDVSSRRRMEEQISRSGRMDAMGRLAGAVAHDFNNLLTVILGYNNLLAERLADTDMAADVDAVRSAAQRAAQLTNQLLDIGRQQVTAPRALDVREFLTTLEPVLRRLVGPSGTLELDLSSEYIFIDPSQLERVVLNLVLNAADAMPDGGSLSIVTRAVNGEDFGVEEGAYVCLAISDTGTGMDPFALEHCFDPFFTTKDRTKGTGLGLAAVYGIVTQTGGQVSVESELGVGTTFSMIFPTVTPEVPMPEAEAVGAPARVSGVERILLVEDQDDVRRLLSDELTRNGYAVVDVADGPAALFTADEEGPFDLLVTDVIMPGMSGTEVARKLAPTGLPVLFISGHVDEALRRDLDPDADLLSKPFTPQVLVERVRQALDRAANQGSKR